MKRIAFVFFAFIFLGCVGQKRKVFPQIEIAYNAHSRGFYQDIRIQNKHVLITGSRLDKPVEIDLNDVIWNDLYQSILAIDLEKLARLKAPTSERLYDGASTASLKINVDNKEYATQGFDHGHPPLEIEKAIHIITSIAQKR